MGDDKGKWEASAKSRDKESKVQQENQWGEEWKASVKSCEPKHSDPEHPEWIGEQKIKDKCEIMRAEKWECSGRQPRQVRIMRTKASMYWGKNGDKWNAGREIRV